MILETIIKWIIPTILSGVLGYVTKQLKDVKNNHEIINQNNEAIKDSMVLLLRSQIVGKCEYYMDLGYLPDYARSCLEDLFKEYTILGGNHGVKALVEQCFNLPPIKKEREEIE